MGTIIQLHAADGHQLDAYSVSPAGAPRGLVVVVPEIFGVNGHIRSVADGYAADGYLAIAPAMFDRVQRNYETGYTQPEIGAGVEKRQANRRLPGNMHHGVKAARKRRFDIGRLAHIAMHELGRGVDLFAFAGALVVEHHGLMPARDQQIDDMTADETSPAGNEDAHHGCSAGVLVYTSTGVAGSSVCGHGSNTSLSARRVSERTSSHSNQTVSSVYR